MFLQLWSLTRSLGSWRILVLAVPGIPYQPLDPVKMSKGWWLIWVLRRPWEPSLRGPWKCSQDILSCWQSGWPTFPFWSPFQVMAGLIMFHEKKKCMLHTSSLQYGCCIARRNCTHTHVFVMYCLNMCDHIISYSSAQFNYNVMVFKYSLCHTILYPTGGFGESYVWANRDFLQHLLPLDVDDVGGLHTIRFMINVSNFS